MQIGKAIIKLRKEKKISQVQLAIKTKIPQKLLSEIERDKTQPSKNQITRICKGLKIPKTALAYFALELKDIPKKNRALHKSISPAIKKMIKSLL
jgi:transcriptional regulator with XRE-family HTH domain